MTRSLQKVLGRARSDIARRSKRWKRSSMRKIRQIRSDPVTSDKQSSKAGCVSGAGSMSLASVERHYSPCSSLVISHRSFVTALSHLSPPPGTNPSFASALIITDANSFASFLTSLGENVSLVPDQSKRLLFAWNKDVSDVTTS